jgi:hypothetical protein
MISIKSSALQSVGIKLQIKDISVIEKTTNEMRDFLCLETINDVIPPNELKGLLERQNSALILSPNLESTGEI